MYYHVSICVTHNKKGTQIELFVLTKSIDARINYAFIHSPPHHSPREPTHSTVTDNNIDTSLLLLLQANLKFEIVTKTIGIGIQKQKKIAKQRNNKIKNRYQSNKETRQNLNNNKIR